MSAQLGDVRTYELSRDQLTYTWSLLRESGRRGLEAAVLWLGRQTGARTAIIERVVRPRQWATRGEHGVGVALDAAALTELILGLDDGEFVLARLHTHPATAYHSHIDDDNTVIGHEGAISIVVPEFAAGPADLQACSVNILRADGWEALPAPDIAERFTIR